MSPDASEESKTTAPKRSLTPGKPAQIDFDSTRSKNVLSSKKPCVIGVSNRGPTNRIHWNAEGGKVKRDSHAQTFEGPFDAQYKLRIALPTCPICDDM